jgi:hypothetical protein
VKTNVSRTGLTHCVLNVSSMLCCISKSSVHWIRRMYAFILSSIIYPNVEHIRHYQRGRKGETQEGGEL